MVVVGGGGGGSIVSERILVNTSRVLSETFPSPRICEFRHKLFFFVYEFVGRTKEVDVGEGGCSLWCFVEKNSGLCGGAIEDGVSDVKECVLLTLFLH